MHHKRLDGYGVVWRQTPKETRVNTLYFTNVVKIEKCKCCGEYLPVTHFYISSKNHNQVRDICVKCWDETNGNYSQSKRHNLAGFPKPFSYTKSYSILDFLD